MGHKVQRKRQQELLDLIRFTLEWKDDDTVWLRLEGGPGVKEAIAAEMGFESQR